MALLSGKEKSQEGVALIPSKAWVKAQGYWHRNERYLAAEFFLAGFVFDLITLHRIDDKLTIIQQGLFILITLILLLLKTQSWSPPQQWPPWLVKAWGFHTEGLHFLFGSLLSGFTVFYFKSSSLFVSSGFLALLLLLLVANEMKKFKQLELPFKWSLFSLCLISYLAYLVPITLGFMGLSTFLIGLFLALLVFAFIYGFLHRRICDKSKLRRQIVLPGLSVLGSFSIAYWLQIIPPVPLSIKYIGIYHQVQRTPEGVYELYHQRPWWKFWQNGDQTFMTSPGDKIYCYFRLFSPARFEDKVQLRWLKKDPDRGWETQDILSLKIAGGRSEGFRGFGTKANYSPGAWRVQVETSEGHEIGRIYFEIVPEKNEENRTFHVDRQ